MIESSLTHNKKNKIETIIAVAKLVAEKVAHLNRLYSVILHDFLMATFAFFISIQIVADIREFEASQLLENVFVFWCCVMGIFFISGSYRWMWRFISRKDVVMMTMVSTAIAVLYAAMASLMTQQVSIPGSHGVVLWFVLVACFLLPRFLLSFAKAYIEDYRNHSPDHKKKRVYILGIGENAARFIREHSMGKSADYEVLGIIAPHVDYVGRQIHGVPICGTPSRISSVIKSSIRNKRKADKFLILEDDFSEADLVKTVDTLENYNLALYVFSWQPGKVTKIVDSRPKQTPAIGPQNHAIF